MCRTLNCLSRWTSKRKRKCWNLVICFECMPCCPCTRFSTIDYFNSILIYCRKWVRLGIAVMIIRGIRKKVWQVKMEWLDGNGWIDKSHSRTPVTWSYMIAGYERLRCRCILRGCRCQQNSGGRFCSSPWSTGRRCQTLRPVSTSLSPITQGFAARGMPLCSTNSSSGKLKLSYVPKVCCLRAAFFCNVYRWEYRCSNGTVSHHWSFIYTLHPLPWL